MFRCDVPTRRRQFLQPSRLHADPTCGTLVLVRPTQLADVFCEYRILVDGQEVGTISCGEEMQHSLAAGAHEVEAQCGWTPAVCATIQIRAGQTTTLEVGNNTSGWRFFTAIYFAFARSGYLYLRLRPSGFPVADR